MKRAILGFLAILLPCLFLAGCGTDKDLEKFRTDFENFCINISALDTAINGIDAESEDAKNELLKYIDQLNAEFATLAAMDFPEEFDALEPLAEEAGSYMAEAASAYHTAYEGETFAENYSDYAYENYMRAYRRVQIIITYLHGEEPQDADLTSDE